MFLTTITGDYAVMDMEKKGSIRYFMYLEWVSKNVFKQIVQELKRYLLLQ